MKNTILPNGIFVREMESLKEAKSFIMDNYIENKDLLDDDSSLWIEYKDGSEYYISGEYEVGKFKKTGIKRMIESNPGDWTTYGKYEVDFDGVDCYILE